MREDGLDEWVRFWAAKRQERRRAQHGDQAPPGERREKRTQIAYDAAIILAGLLGILALIRALVAAMSG